MCMNRYPNERCQKLVAALINLCDEEQATLFHIVLYFHFVCHDVVLQSGKVFNVPVAVLYFQDEMIKKKTLARRVGDWQGVVARYICLSKRAVWCGYIRLACCSQKTIARPLPKSMNA